MTPFKAVYGRDPPKLIRYVPNSGDTPDLQQQLIERDQLLQQLKANLQKAQQTMKTQADRKRTDVSLEIGDQVLVKLQPYRQNSVALRKNQKLGMHYFGPFKIIERIGQVAYRLQLPETARIHPVFHISQLKLFKGVPITAYVPLPLTTAAEGPILAPECILNKRTVLQGTQQMNQVLVKWQQIPTAEATWENEQDIAENYPNLNLEDKIAFEGEGNVMNNDVDIVANGGSETREHVEKRVSNRLKKIHPRWDHFVRK